MKVLNLTQGPLPAGYDEVAKVSVALDAIYQAIDEHDGCSIMALMRLYGCDKIAFERGEVIPTVLTDLGIVLLV